ncbi:hypothetical protein [Vagococcus lutrae]|uniref:hypothetical protein n=1 Tax=Vagococcus lutrae TaxID=81947 RepID=UPI0028913979|nr:hypothetical protein [Vagococcus lutrae]MDT2844785.1 hypothetical protein [Vagococcus lutrae]
MENRIVEVKGTTGSGFSLVINAYIEKAIKENKVLILTDTPNDFDNFEKENLTLITDDYEQVSFFYKKIEAQVIYIQNYQGLLDKLDRIFGKRGVAVFKRELLELQKKSNMIIITSN